MPFNEEYKEVMDRIAETGQSAAQVYAETHTESATGKESEGSGSKSVDWGSLVNSFASVAQNYANSRNNGGRQWNDFNVKATVDESTQKTIIFVVVILAGALIFYGLKANKK